MRDAESAPDVYLQRLAASSPPTLTGARAIAEQALTFSHMAKDARVSSVGGKPALIVTRRGRLATVMTFEITGDRITAIDIITEPARLSGLSGLNLT